jgi:hypothetical protein
VYVAADTLKTASLLGAWPARTLGASKPETPTAMTAINKPEGILPPITA